MQDYQYILIRKDDIYERVHPQSVVYYDKGFIGKQNSKDTECAIFLVFATE